MTRSRTSRVASPSTGVSASTSPSAPDDLLEQILRNYRALLEGARFLDDLGMYDEEETFLAAIRG